MLYVCWSAKGGVGTSAIAAALAIRAAQTQAVLLVDLAGDQPAILGLPEPEGPGVTDWLAAGAEVPVNALAELESEVTSDLSLLHCGTALPSKERLELLAAVLAGGSRTVVVDAGVVPAGDVWWHQGVSICVVRACYLVLRRLGRLDPATRLVVISEPGRALRAADVAAATGVPIWVHLMTDPAVARAVDAGLFVSRLPRSLRQIALPA